MLLFGTSVSSSFACTKPTGLNASAITSSAAVIKWNDIADTTVIGHVVSYRPVGVSVWQDRYVTDTSINLIGLLGCTNYEVHVRTLNQYSTLCDSVAVISFTTNTYSYCPNRPPVANYDAFVKDSGVVSKNLKVLLNDYDVDGTPLVIDSAYIVSGSGSVLITGAQIQHNGAIAPGDSVKIRYRVASGGGTSEWSDAVLDGGNATSGTTEEEGYDCKCYGLINNGKFNSPANFTVRSRSVNIEYPSSLPNPTSPQISSWARLNPVTNNQMITRVHNFPVLFTLNNAAHRINNHSNPPDGEVGEQAVMLQNYKQVDESTPTQKAIVYSRIKQRLSIGRRCTVEFKAITEQINNNIGLAVDFSVGFSISAPTSSTPILDHVVNFKITSRNRDDWKTYTTDFLVDKNYEFVYLINNSVTIERRDDVEGWITADLKSVYVDDFCLIQEPIRFNEAITSSALVTHFQSASVVSAYGNRITAPSSANNFHWTLNLGNITGQGNAFLGPVTLNLAGLSIDNNFRLMNADVVMDNNAGITVYDGKSFVLERTAGPTGRNTIIRGCDPCQSGYWQGVKLLPADETYGGPTRFTMRSGSTITDAVDGIKAEGTSGGANSWVTIDLDRAFLENNITHIRLTNLDNHYSCMGGGCTDPILIMQGCTLRNRTTAEGCPALPADYGIIASNVYQQSSGPDHRGLVIGVGSRRNFISGTKLAAIHLTNTSLDIERTTFGFNTAGEARIEQGIRSNITGTPPRRPYTGVLGSASFGNNCIFQTADLPIRIWNNQWVNVLEANISNMRKNNAYGIYVEKPVNGVVLSKNTINGAGLSSFEGRGIIVTSADRCTVDVNENNISNVDAGISFNELRRSTLNVLTNTITNVLSDHTDGSAAANMVNAHNSGICVSSCREMNGVNINNNTISQYNTWGILLFNNRGTATSAIYNVNSNFVNDVATPTYETEFGIHLFDDTYAATGLRASVVGNTIKHVRYGVHLLGHIGAQVNNNVITNIIKKDVLYVSDGTFTWGTGGGIANIRNPIGMQAYFNTVNGLSPFFGVSGNGSPSSIYADRSHASTYCNNTLTNMRRGFGALSNNPNTILTQNQINGHSGAGLSINHFGVIGPQYNIFRARSITFDNRWTGNGTAEPPSTYPFTSYDLFSYNSDGNLSPFRLKTNEILSSLYPDLSTFFSDGPPAVAIPFFGLDERGIYGHLVGCPGTITLGIGPLRMADGGGNSGSSEAHSSKSESLGEWEEESANYQQNNGPQDSLAPHLGIFSVPQKEAMIALAQASNSDTSYGGGPFYDRQYDLYYTLQRFPQLRTYHPALDSFYLAHQTGNIGKIVAIYNHIGNANLDSIPAPHIASAGAVLASLVPSRIQEENHKRYFAIKLQRMAVGVDSNLMFSVGQLDTLRAIAIQCPLRGGLAVYDARTALVLAGIDSLPDVSPCMIIPEVMYDSTHGQMLRTTPVVASAADGANATRLMVYPNPARSAFSLAWQGTMESGRYTVYNTSGVVVLTSPFSGANNSQQIDCSAWPSGVYLIRLVGDKGEIFTPKITIHQD
jgi:hypothetical protein